jgi:hypothetical protein
MVPKEVKLGHEHEHEQALSPISSDLPMIYWDSFKGLTHPYDQVCEAATRNNFCDAQTAFIGAHSKFRDT